MGVGFISLNSDADGLTMLYIYDILNSVKLIFNRVKGWIFYY